MHMELCAVLLLWRSLMMLHRRWQQGVSDVQLPAGAVSGGSREGGRGWRLVSEEIPGRWVAPSGCRPVYAQGVPQSHYHSPTACLMGSGLWHR